MFRKLGYALVIAVATLVAMSYGAGVGIRKAEASMRSHYPWRWSDAPEGETLQGFVIGATPGVFLETEDGRVLHQVGREWVAATPEELDLTAAPTFPKDFCTREDTRTDLPIPEPPGVVVDTVICEYWGSPETSDYARYVLLDDNTVRMWHTTLGMGLRFSKSTLYNIFKVGYGAMWAAGALCTTLLASWLIEAMIKLVHKSTLLI